MKRAIRACCRSVHALCLLLLPIPTVAADRVLDVSSSGPEVVSLAKYFAVLEDPSQSLTLADVQKPEVASRFTTGRAPAETLSYGMTRSAYWLRLSLRNASEQSEERMLELAYPVLSDVRFYQPMADGAYQSVTTGVTTPFSTRAYPNRFFVFPLKFQAHSTQVVYLRIQTDSAMLLPVKLWKPVAFHIHEREGYGLQAWYFGMACAMILFNLLFFLALREKIYLLYVVLVLLTALTVSTGSGIGKEYIWPSTTWWSGMASSVLYLCMAVAFLLFARQILMIRELVPWLDRVIWGAAGILLIMLVGVVLSPRTFFVLSRESSLGAGILVVLISSYYAVLKRQPVAIIMVAASCMLMLGPILVGLRMFGLMPVSFLTANAFLLGSTVEMLLMVVALGYRFNTIRRKAADDVQKANETLEARLRTRETELMASHERLREIEQRQTLSEERQRLMQDMHDGLGSSLSSALRVVERGRLDEEQVAQVLKSCIDDLKLAIDSMEPVEADLLLLLATLRFRLQPRLQASGIALRWEVQDLPPLDWLDPRNSLHILRILQEAFTNIIKHTEATEIRVATAVQGDRVLVTIADNGKGFEVGAAQNGNGKGLSNQMRRAQAIGAEVAWKSGKTGTTLTLSLPIVNPTLSKLKEGAR